MFLITRKEEMENKIEKDEWCERCRGHFAFYWMEEFDEMWCVDCRDAFVGGLFTYQRKKPYKNKIENTGLTHDPEVLKQHIQREIGSYYAMCIDANDLENTFDQEEFENWLEEQGFGYYESYTIYKKPYSEGSTMGVS